MKYNIRHFFLFLFSLNLIQSLLTPIARDEAYYWMFGQNLDWGYFDHPPMVALMTFFGDLFFNGELGVRLLTVFMSVGLAYFIWLMIPLDIRKKKYTTVVFSILFLANPLFNVYAFITTPDIPLLFFSGAYLLVFQRFNQDADWKKALLLGFLMSCLIYSKYHGILIILLSVASNLKLFKRPTFYLAGLFGVILYLPHLYWQYQHEFISFEYHLSYRSVLFEWKNVFEYFLNIVLVFNPLLFPFFIISLKSKENNNGRNRLMNFIFFGFFLFFLFTASRGHVEPHWVAVAGIPYTLYLVHFLSGRQNYIKAFKIAGITSLVLIFSIRLVLILPIPLKSEFHTEKKDFYEGIEKHAGGRKVLFINSYTHASKFSFYTGQPSYSYNFISYRKNQYDLIDSQDEFHEKDAMMVLFWPLKRFSKKVLENGEHFYYKNYDQLPLINNITIDILSYEPQVKVGGLNKIEMTVHNPYNRDIDFRKKYTDVLWELYYFFPDKERHAGVSLENVPINTLKANSSQTFNAYFKSDSDPGKYTIGITIRPSALFPISVSKRTYPIEVLAQ